MAKEIKKKPQFQSHTSSDEKKKALENAIAQIEKTYGAGAVMKLGQTKKLDIGVIPTGSMTFRHGFRYRRNPKRQNS